jgi:hypothetical protein
MRLVVSHRCRQKSKPSSLMPKPASPPSTPATLPLADKLQVIAYLAPEQLAVIDQFATLILTRLADRHRPRVNMN